MARWSLLIITPSRAWSVELPSSRSLLVGRGPGVGLELREPGVSDRHATLVVRDDGLVVEALRGVEPLAVNDVPIAGPATLRHGDEVRVGSARLVACFRPAVSPARPRLSSADELVAQLERELARARGLRPLGLVAVAHTGLNVTARAALFRRVIDEVGKAGVVADWGELALDVLVGVLPEVSEAKLSELFSALPATAGPRATVATVRSAADGLDAQALLEALFRRLSTGAGVPEPEPVVADPVMVRLFGLMDGLADGAAPVCLVGPSGAGRATLARRVAAAAGKRLVEALRAPVGEVPPGAWLLVHELDPSVDVLGLPASRVLVTTSGPAPDGFEVVVQVPPLQARPSEVPLLAEAFLAHARLVLGRPRLHLTPEASALLAAWPWPGQVRELRNVMYRAARSALRDEVGRDALPAAMSAVAPVEDLRGAMASAERELLLEALSRTRWNVTATASRLGMARRTVVYRMRRLGLKRPAR